MDQINGIRIYNVEDPDETFIKVVSARFQDHEYKDTYEIDEVPGGDDGEEVGPGPAEGGGRRGREAVSVVAGVQ